MKKARSLMVIRLLLCLQKDGKEKILKGGVIGTLMSNYGLQNYFREQKIRFVRANVGDRYVKEKMQKNKFNLGGEQSGHIILGKFVTGRWTASSIRSFIFNEKR